MKTLVIITYQEDPYLLEGFITEDQLQTYIEFYQHRAMKSYGPEHRVTEIKITSKTGYGGVSYHLVGPRADWWFGFDFYAVEDINNFLNHE